LQNGGKRNLICVTLGFQLARHEPGKKGERRLTSLAVYQEKACAKKPCAVAGLLGKRRRASLCANCGRNVSNPIRIRQDNNRRTLVMSSSAQKKRGKKRG